MLTKKHILLLAFVLVFTLVSACNPETEPAPAEEPEAEEPAQAQEPLEEDESPELTNTELILATTTSTENSGLLDYILPNFTEKHGVEVKVVAVGSGAALQMGADGEADVLLAHAKAQEEELVAAGHGIERFDVMYNDFIIIGPSEDPAELADNAAGDVLNGFQQIAESGVTFVSRGDNSGTHIMEGNLWRELGMDEPTDDWYISSGQGMGDVILMSNELEGYTLTDRATYLSMKDNIEMIIVVEEDPKLFNQYGVIAVNPEKGNHINGEGAALFVEWILSEDTQQLIAEYGVEEFGMPLFFPNAN